jgi:hypothetical protein
MACGTDLMYIAYDKETFPWPQIISELIDEPDLTALRDDDLPMAEVTKDSESRWHGLLYDGFPLIEERYKAFVFHIAMRLFYREELTPDEILYQRVPTFRISLPGNQAVGETHRDTDYGHSKPEVNVWTPCTPSFDSNALHVDDEPVLINPGECFVFAGSAKHGNRVNRTGQSRVSFDWRLLRRKDFKETGRISQGKAHVEFKIGGYWSVLSDAL